MIALQDEKKTFFRCDKCGNYSDAYEFSSSELKAGPRCPLCSDRLVRVPVDVLGRKAEDFSGYEDESVVDHWIASTFWE